MPKMNSSPSYSAKSVPEKRDTDDLKINKFSNSHSSESLIEQQALSHLASDRIQLPAPMLQPSLMLPRLDSVLL